jgi:hypothetical protein
MEQILIARAAGEKRQEFSAHRLGAHGFKGDGLKINIEGATGELALSIFTGEPWIPFSEDFLAIKADVGEWFQVRATSHPRGNLTLYDRDPDFQIFVLVRVHALPVVELCGWYAGKSGKQQCFRENAKKFQSPAYLVWARDLNSMDTLPTQAKWRELIA